MIETDSPDDDSPRELSLYATESYGTGGDSRLRRYALRIDGFGSLRAKSKLGRAETKPLVFGGKELRLNVATSGAGNLRVEICGLDGRPLDGYSFGDCEAVYGDSIEKKVSWNGKSDLSALAGRPVILRFQMKETDLYSLRFAE